MLAALPLRGRLVTADALYCQRKVCAQIREAGGHYLIIVKANQPQLYADIRLLFTEPPVGEHFAAAEQRSQHGGRHEVRRLRASTALREYLDWPGVQQVCEITRTVTQHGNPSSEVRYAITSLAERVQAPTLLGHVRGHWGIENRLHYVRDVTFGEDASQVRSAAAPEVLAALRNAVLGLLRNAGWDNIAAALRHTAWTPGAALQLLGLPSP